MRLRFFGGIVSAAVLGLAVSGCMPQQTSKMSRQQIEANARLANSSSFFSMAQISRIPREVVSFPEKHKPGTIVIKTAERRLYLVQGDGKALRYGIGVGRDGFQWQGLLKITRKQEWPDWTPPEEMIQRQPYLPRFMAGGPGNPLGARAMYLGSTVYRIHGTNRPDTIGTAVSSGCFRLVNADVTDLYERVPVGTKVVVRQRPEL